MTTPETPARGRPLVGLCMIVRDEEVMLPGCLESVRGVVDDIVIVDTGSKDRTRAIAESYGARVSTFEWCDDFSAARNAALEQSRSEWILYLDADERLTAGEGEALRALCARTDADAYLLTIVGDTTLPSGKVRHANAYPRLFRNAPGVRFSGRVHEQIAPAIEARRGTIGESGLTILHLGYDADPDIIHRKCRRNIELLRRQLAGGSGDGYTKFQIGNTLTILGDYAGAKEELESALRMPHVAVPVRGSVCNLLAEIEIRREDVDAARIWVHRSLREVPGQTMAHWFLTAIAVARNESAEGLEHLEVVRKRTEGKAPSGLSFDINPAVEEIEARRGDLLGTGKRWKDAAGAYAGALAREPSASATADKLATVVRLTADPAWTIGFFGASVPAGIMTSALFALHASAHAACGDIEAARGIIRSALARFPSSSALYDAWMALEVDGSHEREALGVVQAALQAGAESPFSCRLGAQVALRGNDVRTAVVCLERMSTRVPDLSGKLRTQLEVLRARLDQVVEHSGVTI